MKNPFFEHNFDVKSYVNQRMLEIEDLQDRSIYKELTEKILVDLYEYQRKSYETLYETVADELKTHETPCSIEIGLTKLEKYDASDQFLFPMDLDDPLPQEHSTASIQNPEEGWKEVVYYNGTYAQAQGYLAENPRLSGIIITSAGQFPVKFSLKKAKKYLNLLKNLRGVFAANGKPWNTVCTAHLERLFEVRLIPEFELPILGDFEKIQVEYGDSAVETQVFPLWNVSHITQTTSSYPTPALDKINYEHEIFAHRLKEHCNYLAENREVQVSSIYLKKGDLVICTQTPTPIEWKLLEIAPKSKGMYEYEVFSNYYAQEFTDTLKYYHRSHIKTKLELKRFLHCLPYGRQMPFISMELRDKLDKTYLNYDMDSFILDEIRHQANRKAMVLTFRSKRKSPQFDQDILSFLVSQVQGLFPEYHCVGQLLEGET